MAFGAAVFNNHGERTGFSAIIFLNLANLSQITRAGLVRAEEQIIEGGCNCSGHSGGLAGGREADCTGSSIIGCT